MITLIFREKLVKYFIAKALRSDSNNLIVGHHFIYKTTTKAMLPNVNSTKTRGQTQVVLTISSRTMAQEPEHKGVLNASIAHVHNSIKHLRVPS